MKVIDLTHTIRENMPMFPGSSSPEIRITSDYEKDGFRERRLSFLSHTGTHADAPAHVIAGGKTLDAFPIDQFIGKALVIDCRGFKANEEIPLAVLNPDSPEVREADFLLFNLGWDKRWKGAEISGGYPLLSDELIRFILSGHFKGVGFDAAGPDAVEDVSLKRHHALLSKGNLIIIENLANLDQCGTGLFYFSCFPLKVAQADGAPVRAVAWTEK